MTTFEKTVPLKGKRIAVVGLGKSGTAVARFCALQGADVIALDDKPWAQLSSFTDKLQGLPIQLELGGIRAEALLSASRIILSPGVPPFLPALLTAQQAGIPITGEFEFASRFIQAPIVGITGTNGKSTVTSLCGAIAAQTGRPFFCGGNLGTPLIEAVGTEAATASGIIVCEISSFQLETVETLHCRAAAILNVTPDHLDRYPSLTAYGDAKARIALNQTKEDILVLNGDDLEVMKLMGRHAELRRPHSLCFSIQADVRDHNGLGVRPNGFIEKDNLVLTQIDSSGSHGSVEEYYPISELQLAGRHNLANALAAFLLMRASGLASYEQVRKAAANFQPLPHRMQKVSVIHGIAYYDDSKGTNVDAVAASLSGFPQPFALIAGGRDKGGSYAPLARVLRENTVRGVVLIGEAAPLIEKALHPETKSVRACSMEEAVVLATKLCKGGDAVILSPACSSFDMFRDYVHRAQAFTEAVALLEKRNPQGGS